jgi:bleomycin hydrolase
MIFALGLYAQSGSITEEMLDSFKKDYDQKIKEYKTLQNAVSNNSIKKLALNRENLGTQDTYFSDQVKSVGITDQKNSGRCWLFTGLNVLRAGVQNNSEVKKIFFSQNYLFFYDQLEKANLFLESIIATMQRPLDDRKVKHLLKDPIGDGGQWTGVADLVEKYGIVPADVFPETYNSNNTSMLSKLLKRKLREDALKLRTYANMKVSLDTIRKKKADMLSGIYRMLRIALGTPPESFTWRYKDNNDKTSELQSYTPLSFAKKYLNIDFDEYVMLMNDPSRPYYKVYEIDMDRHTYDGHNWKYLNLPTEDIKTFAINSIQGKEAMYFSCDVGKMLYKDKGTLDVNNFEFGALFDTEFAMDKKERILTSESGSSHGMALVGVDIDKNGKAVKWLLENSWGASYGHNGFLIFTDKWFDEYMFRLVVNKKYLDTKTLKYFDQEAIQLPIWDPMFSPED